MIEKYSGKVIHGKKNGRKFGYPTVNIFLDSERHLTDTGVFAVEVFFNEMKLNGMLYVGKRPTLKMSELTIEIHIFDFDKEIYNQPIQFSIIKKIREDQFFENIDQLILQIQKDEMDIKKYFSNRN